MPVLCPTADTPLQRLLRAVVLVSVFTLGGALDVLNNSFAQMVARMASFPEEEEHQAAKDRGTGIAAVQPARKGGLRPMVATHGEVYLPIRSIAARPAILHAPATHQSLTGAGIFQHC
jgi:hypothetical protein